MIRRTSIPALACAFCSLPFAVASAQSALPQPVVLPGSGVVTPLAAPSGEPVLSVSPAADLAEREAPAAAEDASGAEGEARSRSLAEAQVFGLSGALRAAVISTSQPLAEPLAEVVGVEPGAARWEPLHGTTAGGLPGQAVGGSAEGSASGLLGEPVGGSPEAPADGLLGEPVSGSPEAAADGLLGVPVGGSPGESVDGLLGVPVGGLPGEPAGGLLGEPVSRDAVVAPDGPGVWLLRAEEVEVEADASTEARLAFITTVPFSRKHGAYLNGYHVGFYPTEGSSRSDNYAPPAAFIEVTPENQDLQISEHFRLRHFLTKDQFDVWPKYLALNLRLVDKLELVIQELNRMGVRALDMHVMSGFRTPQYNGPGGDGRAALSRHMYGDAADVWIDGDHDGYIDDLNGDGKHDLADAAVLLRAVERVEQRYPELIGGAGLYESNDHHGPFVHIDVRGARVRW